MATRDPGRGRSWAGLGPSPHQNSMRCPKNSLPPIRISDGPPRTARTSWASTAPRAFPAPNSTTHSPTASPSRSPTRHWCAKPPGTSSSKAKSSCYSTISPVPRPCSLPTTATESSLDLQARTRPPRLIAESKGYFAGIAQIPIAGGYAHKAWSASGWSDEPGRAVSLRRKTEEIRIRSGGVHTSEYSSGWSSTVYVVCCR
ncbi:hypothetical protein M2272_002690 [Mycobacterium frederiksbergense]|uniref:Uncharacterized protein n=1 Tax=Mycolicibacterium frederiksbergense TaxID=117567 RepID=A0ABT6KZD7_9MYCO|nr:hypothetical protein [Mycolicibacterium frederiksbergense]